MATSNALWRLAVAFELRCVFNVCRKLLALAMVRTSKSAKMLQALQRAVFNLVASCFDVGFEELAQRILHSNRRSWAQLGERRSDLQGVRDKLLAIAIRILLEGRQGVVRIPKHGLLLMSSAWASLYLDQALNTSVAQIMA